MLHGQQKRELEQVQQQATCLLCRVQRRQQVLRKVPHLKCAHSPDYLVDLPDFHPLSLRPDRDDRDGYDDDGAYAQDRPDPDHLLPGLLHPVRLAGWPDHRFAMVLEDAVREEGAARYWLEQELPPDPLPELCLIAHFRSTRHDGYDHVRDDRDQRCDCHHLARLSPQDVQELERGLHHAVRVVVDGFPALQRYRQQQFLFHCDCQDDGRADYDYRYRDCLAHDGGDHVFRFSWVLLLFLRKSHR